jgi:hypothetical protein
MPGTVFGKIYAQWRKVAYAQATLSPHPYRNTMEPKCAANMKERSSCGCDPTTTISAMLRRL